VTLPPFGATQFAQAAHILAGCALAYGSARLIGLPEGYWALVTAVVVTQPDLPHTLAASRTRIVGTLIGAAVGAAAIVGRRHGQPTLPLYAAGMVPLALLTAAWPSLRLSCVTLIVVFLAPVGEGAFLWPMDRVLEIVLGTLAALLVSLVRWPK
ncbi:MAG: FUSC family protein, partial [Acetobacteraceae bacterium]